MGLNATAKNAMLEALALLITYFSLHTAYPAGANEVTGGTPAYARKAVTWDTAAAGQLDAVATFPVFDVPACTVAAVGFYSAITDGTLYGDDDVTDEVFAAQGTYSITAASIDLNG